MCFFTKENKSSITYGQVEEKKWKQDTLKNHLHADMYAGRQNQVSKKQVYALKHLQGAQRKDMAWTDGHTTSLHKKKRMGTKAMRSSISVHTFTVIHIALLADLPSPAQTIIPFTSLFLLPLCFPISIYGKGSKRA